MTFIPGSLTIAKEQYTIDEVLPVWWDTIAKRPVIDFIEAHTGYTLKSTASTEAETLALCSEHGWSASMLDGRAITFEGSGTASEQFSIVLRIYNGNVQACILWKTDGVGGKVVPASFSGLSNLTVTCAEPYVLGVTYGISVSKSFSSPPGSVQKVTVTVNPVNVARTVTLRAGLSANLPSGVPSANFYHVALETEITPSASADGYVTTTLDPQVLDGSDVNLTIDLEPTEPKCRVTVISDKAYAARYQLGALEAYMADPESLGPVVELGKPPVGFDLEIGQEARVACLFEDGVRTAWVVGGNEPITVTLNKGPATAPEAEVPQEPDPIEVPEGKMGIRVRVAVAGTLRYDNDGLFAANPDPVEATGPGYYDLVVDGPDPLCTGGVVLFSTSHGDFEQRIDFHAGSTARIGLGPMRVTAVAEQPFEVYFDSGLLAFLPGDGQLMGTGNAEQPVSFVVFESGYANIALIGTPVVVRQVVDFAPGAAVTVSGAAALQPESGTDPLAGIVSWLDEKGPLIAVVVLAIIALAIGSRLLSR